MRYEIVTRTTTTSPKPFVYRGFKTFVLFNHQMKPEKKAIAISEEGKGVLALLKSNSPILLNQLKGQSGLSNKKWDKAIKELTKNN